MIGATRLIWIIVALALVLAPLGLPPFAMTLLTEAVILGLFAMSLDLMFGYTRLVSFGHAAADRLRRLCLRLDAAAHRHAALVRGVRGRAVDRRHGHRRRLDVHAGDRRLLLDADARLRPAALRHLVQMDLGDGRLGRAGGILRTIGPLGFAALSSKTGFYYLALACLVGGFLVCSALVRSPFGAVLRGIRENEAKTTALGYNTRLYKIAVVAISYGLGGLAGALYAPFAGFANTELLFWLLSGQVLIMVIVGGAVQRHRPCPGRRLLHADGAPAQRLDGGLGALLRPHLHRFRPVRARRDSGARDDAAAAHHREALNVPLLELDGVTRRYGALVALDQVAMTVEEGEVRAVIGPNGAGKTTLFNMITGTVKPTAGTIRFAGLPIAGLPSHQICRLGISRTFQITALFPEMSARANAQLAAQARIRDAGCRSAAQGSSGKLKRSPMQHSSSSAFPPSPTGPPACSRMATNVCSRSPWPWRSSRTCFCSTSRPRDSRSKRRPRRSIRLPGSCTPRG